MRLRHRLVICCLLALGILPSGLAAQTFDLEKYKQFLQQHEHISAEQMLGLYPAGTFAARVPSIGSTVGFLDSIDRLYSLTPHERSLLDRHGFMVTERLSMPTFVQAYGDVFHKDLPVFISTDGILHALHMSYSTILSTTEREVLSDRLQELLTGLHAQVPALAARYPQPDMRAMLIDLDVYLSVPLALLGVPASPHFQESRSTVDDLLALIEAKQPAPYPLFSSSARLYDFSQLTPRGHYAGDQDLEPYFRAMMWLGRTELYLLAPQHVGVQQTKDDIRRQTILSALLLEAARDAGSFAVLDDMENVLSFFVGEQDNVTLPQFRDLFGSLGISRADALLDNETLRRFQTGLEQQAYAFQRITSQILYNDPANPDSIRPASALMLLGQRFIIDSYVTGNVVYDKIVHRNLRVRRMLPSALDVLFALGNDATAHLLQPELDSFHYGKNLASLRYLVDSYDSDFWNASFYTLWLNAVRTLNPPAQREHLPAFMQTAAWWQEKMNTQLAGWAQIRHDNLLYAKQSYSGGVTCSFPCSYVEPIPEFFGAVRTLAEVSRKRFAAIDFRDENMKTSMITYFDRLADHMSTLELIATKELAGQDLSEEEQHFLESMLFEHPGCGQPEYTGWYTHLYYQRAGLQEEDYVIADVHTAPTDAAGNQVGWVLHAGTGPINMGVWTVTMPNGQTTAFVGPVMSYYEHTSVNFQRLTDQEWRDAYKAAPSMRPDFVNIYLADKDGAARGEGPMLLLSEATSVRPVPTPTVLKTTSFPNPSGASTTIGFTVPAEAAYQPVSVSIATAQGVEIRRLLHSPAPTGTYMVRWDGTAADGTPVANGVYYYRVAVGAHEATGTVVIQR